MTVKRRKRTSTGLVLQFTRTGRAIPPALEVLDAEETSG